MPESKPKTSVKIRDFPGLNLESDPHDMAPGAAVVMLNVDASDIGRMKSRLGFRVISFESDS